MENFNEKAYREKFKGHVAKFTDLGNIKILDFKNPDSGEYRIRFLFEEDHHMLHISGDLGELIAYNDCNMTYEHFGDFVNDIGYFTEKILCHSRPLYFYEKRQAKKELMEYLKEATGLEENEHFFLSPCYSLEERVDEIMELYSDDGFCSSDNAYQLISEIDTDCFEYIKELGKEKSGILELYMLAFKLASEQLKRGL